MNERQQKKKKRKMGHSVNILNIFENIMYVRTTRTLTVFGSIFWWRKCVCTAAAFNGKWLLAGEPGVCLSAFCAHPGRKLSMTRQSAKAMICQLWKRWFFGAIPGSVMVMQSLTWRIQYISIWIGTEWHRTILLFEFNFHIAPLLMLM